MVLDIPGGRQVAQGRARVVDDNVAVHHEGDRPQLEKGCSVIIEA